MRRVHPETTWEASRGEIRFFPRDVIPLPGEAFVFVAKEKVWEMKCIGISIEEDGLVTASNRGAPSFGRSESPAIDPEMQQSSWDARDTPSD